MSVDKDARIVELEAELATSRRYAEIVMKHSREMADQIVGTHALLSKAVQAMHESRTEQAKAAERGEAA